MRSCRQDDLPGGEGCRCSQTERVGRSRVKSGTFWRSSSLEWWINRSLTSKKYQTSSSAESYDCWVHVNHLCVKMGLMPSIMWPSSFTYSLCSVMNLTWPYRKTSILCLTEYLILKCLHGQNHGVLSYCYLAVNFYSVLFLCKIKSTLLLKLTLLTLVSGFH